MLSIHTLCSNPNLKLLSMFICPDWRSPSYGLSSLPFFQPLMPSCCLSSQPPLPKVILLNVGGREAHLATCDARAGRWWWWMREGGERLHSIYLWSQTRRLLSVDTEVWTASWEEGRKPHKRTNAATQSTKALVVSTDQDCPVYCLRA